MSGGLTSRCEQLAGGFAKLVIMYLLKLCQDIQKLECYLPLLENLVHHINSNGKNRQVICWILNLKIRWSSVLTPSSIFHLHGPKFYQVDDMYFELGMMLFLYGALIRERALEVLSSDMVQSATLFRKAAGVYSYLAQQVFNNLSWTQERPPEATPSVSFVMSLICLAEAQAVTAKKAEENGNTGGLLAKLHCGVKEFMVEAINILQVATKECKDVPSRLLDFMLSCRTLHESMSYKYLVQGLKNDGKIGMAIGYLRWAVANAKQNVPKDEPWKLVYKQVIDDLTGLLQKYDHENEFVWHEKVPFYDELPLPLQQAWTVLLGGSSALKNNDIAVCLSEFFLAQILLLERGADIE
ncbi:hypothetical protein DH2020_032529 [Rehmannia glutinosa]|uniref:BRO1 domain-containing protein n=1 Tax=Rehmannia glutinosa TaxID=99300 RepID=A0ABR0VGW5_REHGL